MSRWIVASVGAWGLMVVAFWATDIAHNLAASATAAATIVGVPWLIYYARQTYLLVEETRQLRQDNQLPILDMRHRLPEYPEAMGYIVSLGGGPTT